MLHHFPCLLTIDLARYVEKRLSSQSQSVACLVIMSFIAIASTSGTRRLMAAHCAENRLFQSAKTFPESQSRTQQKPIFEGEWGWSKSLSCHISHLFKSQNQVVSLKIERKARVDQMSASNGI